MIGGRGLEGKGQCVVRQQPALDKKPPMFLQRHSEGFLFLPPPYVLREFGSPVSTLQS